MVTVTEDGPEGAPGAVVPDITPHPVEAVDEKTSSAAVDEKNLGVVEETGSLSSNTIIDEATKIYVPDESEEFIDPSLKDYPIPLVAKTVDLHNDFKSVDLPTPSSHHDLCFRY